VKNFLFLAFLFCGTSFNGLNSTYKSDHYLITASLFTQDEPFYFDRTIPAKLRLLDNVNLSFFKSPLISLYRFKVEIPDGASASIDKRLIIWSEWTDDDFADIEISRIDHEGKYKLIIEYKRRNIDIVKRFEKQFYVYSINLATNTERVKAETVPKSNTPSTGITSDSAKSLTKETPDKNKTLAQAAPGTDMTTGRTTPVISRITINTSSITSFFTDIRSDKLDPEIEPMNKTNINSKDINSKDIVIKNNPGKTALLTETKPSELSVKASETGKISEPDYNKLFANAIEGKDTTSFRRLVQNGAGSEMKGVNVGNIFHLINETIADEELIGILKSRGISLNEKDNYGNSPLHLAILSGDTLYAESLINAGAELNVLNVQKLSPLHLAAILNNGKAAKSLIIKGAEIDLKGNSGYTALHIASEMNHFSLAKELLLSGAKRGIKTDQNLNSRTIAKIQGNNEIGKLISKKGKYSVNPSALISKNDIINLNSTKPYPELDFNLTYDKEMVKERQFNKVLQRISIPVFALSAAGFFYLKSELNNYYYLSKIAETEGMARGFYNKGNQYNTYAYISGGISLASIYGFVHSTIRKKKISNNMYKKIY
jgi:ankyrin repeat protein